MLVRRFHGHVKGGVGGMGGGGVCQGKGQPTKVGEHACSCSSVGVLVIIYCKIRRIRGFCRSIPRSPWIKGEGSQCRSTFECNKRLGTRSLHFFTASGAGDTEKVFSKKALGDAQTFFFHNVGSSVGTPTAMSLISTVSCQLFCPPQRKPTVSHVGGEFPVLLSGGRE